MSLTDKVIKNTIYYLIAQIAGFIFPLFLTPFIISVIGTEQFGIYALVLGFTGTIGLFDLSVSSSFIKFISEHYNKKDYKGLNEIINTGLIFYITFSLIFCTAAYIFAEPLLRLVNIPPALYDVSMFAFRMSLLIFFITTSFGVFNSILISLQKMYITSVFGILINVINFIMIIILLSSGYGLYGLLYSQLIAVSLSILLSWIVAKRELSVMKISLRYLSKTALKKMTGFGLQMQVSKLASFASDKYDEFLLAFFSVLNNVAFFNISGRIIKFGRFIPFQLVPQVAPVAAELKAKENEEKLKQLFNDTTKYLTLISVPVFTYIFVFADVIITSWMGTGFEISVYLLRILALGQLSNMILSAPGNSITPNIGLPRFQMYEGLINLLVNLVLSYILIKYYGIIGAAFGNAASMFIASVYVYLVSAKYFSENRILLLKSLYLKPFVSAVTVAVVLFAVSSVIRIFIPQTEGRADALIYLLPTFFLFASGYLIWILNFNYLNQRDREVLLKILIKVIPVNILIKKRKRKLEKKIKPGEGYKDELISFFIITYNRLDFLKKCLKSLLDSLQDVNYEIIIWDNNSDDGTKDFLSEIKNEKIKTVIHDKNIGTNAKGYAAEMCKGEFITGIDDDVIEFTPGWVQKMVYAYKNIPGIGYLVTDVVQDEYTNGAKYPEESYEEKTYDNGNIVLLHGPTGGWCFMLSREVYNTAGKLTSVKGRIFYSEDGEYINRLINKGYIYGILKDVKVYHATGDKLNKNYEKIFNEKMKDYFEAKNPLWLSIKERLSYLFRFRKFYYKFLELAEKELGKGE